jgi:tetratricopeptide (TPR) repeat protein
MHRFSAIAILTLALVTLGMPELPAQRTDGLYKVRTTAIYRALEKMKADLVKKLRVAADTGGEFGALRAETFADLLDVKGCKYSPNWPDEDSEGFYRGELNRSMLLYILVSQAAAVSEEPLDSAGLMQIVNEHFSVTDPSLEEAINRNRYRDVLYALNWSRISWSETEDIYIWDVLRFDIDTLLTEATGWSGSTADTYGGICLNLARNKALYLADPTDTRRILSKIDSIADRKKTMPDPVLPYGLYGQAARDARMAGDTAAELAELQNLFQSSSRFMRDSAIIQAHRRAVELLAAIGDNQSLADHYYCAGASFDSANVYSGSRSNFKTAVDIYVLLGDSVGVAKCNKGTGDLFMDQEYTGYNRDSAIYYYSKARDYYAAKGMQVDQSEILKTMASHCYPRRHQGPERLQLYRQALELCRNAGDSTDVSGALFQLAYEFGRQQHFDSAVFCHRMAWDLIDPPEDRHVSFAGLSYRASWLFSAGDTVEALAILRRAKDQLKTATMDPYMLSTYLHHHSTNLKWSGLYQEALATLREGTQIALDGDADYPAILSMLEMAICFSHLGQQDSANHYIQESLSLAQEQKEAELEVIHTLMFWGEHLGEKGLVDSAEAVIRKASQIDSASGLDLQTVYSFQALAKIYETNDMVPEAIDALETALKRSHESELRYQYEILHGLGVLSEKNGDPKKALEYYEQAAENVDTIRHIGWWDAIEFKRDSLRAVLEEER